MEWELQMASFMEWEHTNNAIEKVGNDILGRKSKYKCQKGLRIWKGENHITLQQKDKIYTEYL